MVRALCTPRWATQTSQCPPWAFAFFKTWFQWSKHLDPNHPSMKNGYWKPNSYLLVKSVWDSTVDRGEVRPPRGVHGEDTEEDSSSWKMYTKTNCDFLLIHKTYVLSNWTAPSGVCTLLFGSAFWPCNTVVTQMHRSLWPDLHFQMKCLF